MMDEFGIDDLDRLGPIFCEKSRQACWRRSQDQAGLYSNTCG